MELHFMSHNGRFRVTRDDNKLAWWLSDEPGIALHVVMVSETDARRVRLITAPLRHKAHSRYFNIQFAKDDHARFFLDQMLVIGGIVIYQDQE